VQTQFGFHLILREESRAQTPPPLDAVKEQLMPFLQRQKIETMLKGLRTAAKVEVLIPLTEEKPVAVPVATPTPSAAPAEAAPATIESVQPTTAEPAAPAAEAAPAVEPAK
jgi:peptidyl-prolyl cis-trans isomerase C